jgi:hypothetical protein
MKVFDILVENIRRKRSKIHLENCSFLEFEFIAMVMNKIKVRTLVFSELCLQIPLKMNAGILI